MAEPVTIDFTLGSRRLLGVTRKLATWAFSLEEILAAGAGTLIAPPPVAGSEGVRILSAPTAALAPILGAFPGFIAGARQDYRRHYIDMNSGFADYMARFSGKTRSTLRRKARKLAEKTGGYTVTQHRTPDDVARFLDLALPLSARTYQARLLDAGLPAGTQARAAMLAAAEDDRMRCFLLHAGGQPIAYLALPVTGRTLIYAHLGYDPAWAALSPGTVLQMEALAHLFGEGRYGWFDFTEGDGAHKALFGTHSTPCTSLILLRPSLANRALLGARDGFDRVVAEGRQLADRSGALAPIRNLLRA